MRMLYRLFYIYKKRAPGCPGAHSKDFVGPGVAGLEEELPEATARLCR